MDRLGTHRCGRRNPDVRPSRLIRKESNRRPIERHRPISPRVSQRDGSRRPLRRVRAPVVRRQRVGVHAAVVERLDPVLDRRLDARRGLRLGRHVARRFRLSAVVSVRLRHFEDGGRRGAVVELELVERYRSPEVRAPRRVPRVVYEEVPPVRERVYPRVRRRARYDVQDYAAEGPRA